MNATVDLRPAPILPARGTEFMPNMPIHNWKQFARRVRSKGCGLLARLDDFPRSVLVTGCQRSGTTMLSRIITQSDGMVNYWFGTDDELDAALILSGAAPHEPRGRYCFQTTYLNECYREYFQHQNGHKVIWVLRNPYSVVYSLLHNWTRFALNELFQACGTPYLDERQRRLYGWFGTWGVSRLHRAVSAYNGKVCQLFELYEGLGPDRVLVVDYDELVRSSETVLPAIYSFIELAYRTDYARAIHAKSLRKADRLSSRERRLIEAHCVPVYERARKLVALFSRPGPKIRSESLNPDPAFSRCLSGPDR